MESDFLNKKQFSGNLQSHPRGHIYVLSYPTKGISDRERQAALGFSFLPLVARARGNQKSAESKDGPRAETLIADLEKLISKLMDEIIVPGLSIAVIMDAKLAWRRGFGFKDSASKTCR